MPIATDSVRVFALIKCKEGVPLEDLKKYLLEVYPQKVRERPSFQNWSSHELIFSNANFTSSSQPLVKAPQATPFDVIIQTDVPSGDSFVNMSEDEAKFFKETEDRVKEVADVLKTVVMRDIKKVL